MDIPSGYLLLNKKPGFTSFGALNRFKKLFAPAKIGHAGTLDKFASGLLIVLVGRASKLNPWFSGSSKEYRGTIRLGLETDTLDPEGKPVAEGEIPSWEGLEAVLGRFRGPILQTPPAYSAVHLDGERAHVLARSGAALEMKARSVTIHQLELLSFEPPLAEISVRCSKGTYIRSLARDIALAAGSRGHLAALIRLSIAGFSLADAVDMDVEDEALRLALRPVGAAAFAALGIETLTVDRAMAEKIRRGMPLARDPGGLQTIAGLFGEDGNLLAVIERPEGQSWRYGYVYGRAP